MSELIITLSAEEMRMLLKPHKRPAGLFIARMENGEWTGADTHHGACPRKKTGSFSEVIEWLIPFTGEVRNATEHMTGYRVTADGAERIPYDRLLEADGRAPRYGIRLHRCRGAAESDDLSHRIESL